jgi:hypothetical protein
MSFEHEVFISYAHLDNKPILDEEKGWITQFDELLDTLLGQYLGSEARIWRDNMLRGDDIIRDTISLQLPRIAVMVSILSPRYIKSEWCLWEVKEFCEKARQTGGFRIGNKSRIYKVVKTPIRNGEPPTIFNDLKGYEFFHAKDKDNRPREFGVGYGAEEKKNFLDRVGDVAYDIANLLEIIRVLPDENEEQRMADEPPPDDEPPQNGGAPNAVVIYLAEPTPDLYLEYSNIRRDLLQRGYKVLPEQPLPIKADEAIAQAREDLEQCSLSIHLIGEEYGLSPEGDTRSYAYLHNMLAEKRDSDPNFSRLIWMPKGNKPEEVRQWGFVKELLNATTSGNTDLLQTALEEFKTAIQDMIKDISEGKTKSRHEPKLDSDARTIYIVYDKMDAEAAGLLDTYLLSMGYETYLPMMGDDEAANRKDHDEKLLKCDAVLVYWNSAPKLWLLMKLDDLQKVRGYGRPQKLLSKTVYIAGERTPEKERFRARDALVIKNFGEASPLTLESALQSFIDELENAKEGNVRENF